MNFPAMEDNKMNQAALFHVLSLEDSDLDFEIISEQLIHAGYHLNISRATEKDEFTLLIQNDRFDVILADYNLPRFDAFEALAICQEHCPDIPFICVSGTIGETRAIELLKNGATDYVLKDRLERLPFAINRAIKEASEKIQKKQVERSLLESEEKYRTIFENIQDVFYQIDLNGIILEISPSIKNISGIGRNELLNKSVYDFYFDPRERELFLHNILKKGEVQDYEVSFKTVKGEIKQTSINARVIHNSQGEPDHIDGTLRDITERKQAEEAIRQSEAELNFAQQIAKMGSWDINLQTNKCKWSKNMYQILGYQSRELGTKKITYDDFINKVHPDDRHLIDMNIQKIKRTKKGVSYDFRYVLPDGQIIWVQNNIIAAFKEDTLIELHGVYIDITEKKKAEQELVKAKEKAEASDQLKTAFMNNISHEIRTPLNGILGFGQIIADPDIPTREKGKYVRMLQHSGDRLLNTVTNFMDISLLASGNQKMDRSEIILGKFMQELRLQFKDASLEKGLRLVVKLPSDDKEYKIKTDEVLLGKILFQLIDNAIKFTPQGQITFGFEQKEKEFHFFVKDSGIGISEGNRNKIFGNFDQADNASTRKFQGTGIGLSIAKGLTELLGGKLWLDSKREKGSTFYFSIPFSG